MHWGPVHTKPQEFKNAAITGHFVFVFEDNSFREITWLSWRHRFRKAPFSKCFPFTRKRKAGVFKFLRVEERFRKAPFSSRISVDGRPNRFRKAPFSWRISADGRPNWKNKAAFSNFFGLVWTLPEFLWHFPSKALDCIKLSFWI